MMQCDFCRWWDKRKFVADGDNDRGICRVDSPKIEGGWPVTRHDDFCGKYFHEPNTYKNMR